MSNTNKDINNETNIESSEIPSKAKPKKESIFKTTVKKITKPPKKEEKSKKQEKPTKMDQHEVTEASDVNEAPASEEKTTKTKAVKEKAVKEKSPVKKPAKEKAIKPIAKKEDKRPKKKAKEDKPAEVTEKTESGETTEQKDILVDTEVSAIVEPKEDTENIEGSEITHKTEKKADEKKTKATKEKVEKKKPLKEKVIKEKVEKNKKTKEKDSKEKNESKSDDKKKEVPKPEKKHTEKKEKSKAEKKPADKTEKKSSEKWSIKSLGGYLFAKMLKGGANELHSKADEVNKLNVFPVPDGDTGDNMAMTIESGVASLENIDTDDLAEVLKVASRGMLLGARGNSGVILSQFFAGMAKGLENVETADAKKLARALELGVQQAYTSVMTPTEGTILTVAREAVEYAVSRVTSKSTVQTLFSDLVNEMNASLQRTPEILPILGEAGVVDSGGAGLLYIIDGLNRVLNGEDIEDVENPMLQLAKTNTTHTNTSFDADSEMEFGYCTELLVQLMNRKIKENPFDLDALKLYLASYGDSIVAFQTESIVKIHVHTLRPDKIMRYMLKFGDFISIKVENMSLQHTELEAEESDEEPTIEKFKKKYGIVAVSNGEGISSLFRELGADEIVEGGQTNNPSTNDFIAAFDNINAENIFVFPNNGNIVMAASQAAEIYDKAKIYVVPTKSIGAGYVAMSTMSFDMSEPDQLMAEAEDAIGRITAAYVSPAVRDADMNGVHITDGDTMGIIGKEIVISGPDKMVSTYGLIDILLAETGRYMITIFHGKDATIEERDMLAEYMLNTYPMVEAYFVDGGQEIYPFLFVAE